MLPFCRSALSRLVQFFFCFIISLQHFCASLVRHLQWNSPSFMLLNPNYILVAKSVCVWYVHRALSTMTCAGLASIWLWCGSTRLWCWWVSCCHRATATCSTAQPLTWAAGRNWSTARTATRRSTCERPFVFALVKHQICVCNCSLGVCFFFLDGQKAPSGPKECWCDTVDLCTRPSGLITWLCPQMSPMPGFMWVFLISLKQQQQL